MLRSKYFFEQFGDEIAEEVRKYDAHDERRELKRKKCDHRKAIYTDGEIRCPCGAGWTGPRLSELAQKLKIKSAVSQ